MASENWEYSHFLSLTVKKNLLNGKHGYTLSTTTLLRWVLGGIKLKNLDLQKSIAHYESNHLAFCHRKDSKGCVTEENQTGTKLILMSVPDL